MQFPQVIPASVTPFDATGKLDLPSLAKHLSYLEAGGCTGVVLAGTNGEGVSLSAPEKRDLLFEAMKLRGDLHVVLGIATNSASEAIWLCKQAHHAGADSVLLMAPFFHRNAPEAGIELWIREVLDASLCPVLLYHHPKQTGITFSPELMRRLDSHDRFIGMKDSSGDPAFLLPFRQALSQNKLLLTGCEPLLLESLRVGWTGTISGAANLVPQWLSTIARHWSSDLLQAEIKFEILLPALESIRCFPQPAANKAVLHSWGILNSATVRHPLESLNQTTVGNLLQLLEDKLGLKKDNLGVRTIA